MPKRIQRKRTKGWRMPPNAVYVGRPTKWGNPFNWQDVNSKTIPENVAKQYAKELYKTWLSENHIDETWLSGDGFINTDKKFLDDRRQGIFDHFHELKNSDLACWCSLDQPCHADVLLEIANKE